MITPQGGAVTFRLLAPGEAMDDSSTIATAAAESDLQPIHKTRWGPALLVTTACLLFCALVAALAQRLVAPHATQSPSELAFKQQSPDEAALQTRRLLELARLEEKAGQQKTLVPPTSSPPPPLKSEPPNPPEAVPVVKKEAPAVQKKPAPPVVQEKKPENLASIGLKRRQSSRTVNPLNLQRLLAVPEIDLDKIPDTTKDLMNEDLLKRFKAKATDDFPDQVLADVVAWRTDLVGLPLVLGQECRLSQTAATNLQLCATELRCAWQSLANSQSKEFRYAVLNKAGQEQKPEAVPALQQLLMSEEDSLRQLLVEALGQIKGQQASIALARRATFELNPDIREKALNELKKRPSQEYLHVFLEALRYPWAEAANHAAEALVFLRLEEAVPRLVRLLDQPDPTAPFETVVNQKKTVVVRELVRINHLRNCLLCHPPSFAQADPLRGPVPSAGEKVPSLLDPVVYSKSEGNFVRGDVTYLRQDFAVTLPVTKPGLWPAKQRFDFLIRVRPLTKAELTALAKQKKAVDPQLPCEHRQAALFALGELAGRLSDFDRKKIPLK
jgi:hypothetical protein